MFKKADARARAEGRRMEPREGRAVKTESVPERCAEVRTAAALGRGLVSMRD